MSDLFGLFSDNNKEQNAEAGDDEANNFFTEFDQFLQNEIGSSASPPPNIESSSYGGSTNPTPNHPFASIDDVQTITTPTSSSNHHISSNHHSGHTLAQHLHTNNPQTEYTPTENSQNTHHNHNHHPPPNTTSPQVSQIYESSLNDIDHLENKLDEFVNEQADDKEKIKTKLRRAEEENNLLNKKIGKQIKSTQQYERLQDENQQLHQAINAYKIQIKKHANHDIKRTEKLTILENANENLQTQLQSKNKQLNTLQSKYDDVIHKLEGYDQLKNSIMDHANTSQQHEQIINNLRLEIEQTHQKYANYDSLLSKLDSYKGLEGVNQATQKQLEDAKRSISSLNKKVSLYSDTEHIISELNAQIAATTQELEMKKISSKGTIDQLNHKINTLTDTNMTLQSDAEGYSLKVQDLNDRIDELTTDMDDTVVASTKLNQANESLQTQMVSLQRTIEQIQGEKRALEKDLLSNRGLIETAKEENEGRMAEFAAKMKATVLRHDDEVRQKNERIIALESRIEDVNGDNESLLEQQEQLNETLDELETEINQLKNEHNNEGELHQLKLENEQLQRSKSELLAKLLDLETLQNEREGNRIELESVKKENKELREKMNGSVEEVHGLKALNGNLQKDMDGLQERYNAVDGKMKLLIVKHNEMQIRCNELGADRENNATQIEKLQTQCNGLLDEQKEFETKNNELLRAKTEFETKYDTLLQTKSEFETKYDALLQSKNEFETKLKAVEEENQKEIDTENSKLNELSEKADKYKKLVDKLQEITARNKQQIKHDKESYDELDAKYQQLRQENENLNTLGKDLEQLTQNRNELESMLNKSEAERNKLADTNCELMTNLRDSHQTMEEYELKNTALHSQLHNKESENQHLRDNLTQKKQSEIDELKSENTSLQNELENMHKKISLTPSEPASISITPWVTPAQSPPRHDAEKLKLKEKIRKFQKNFQIVKEKYKELRSKLDLSKDALGRKDADLVALREELQRVTRMATDTEQHAQIQKARISDGQSQQNALEVRVAELERLLNVTQQQKEDTQRVSVQLQSELELLRKDKEIEDGFAFSDGGDGEELDALKRENEGLKVEKNALLDENKTLKKEKSELLVKVKENAVQKRPSGPGFAMFDNAPSRTVTEPCTPNKNQTAIGKKELAKLRKKAEQFTTLLTKAKALKDKNKELKAEINRHNEMKPDMAKIEQLERELTAEVNKNNEMKNEMGKVKQLKTEIDARNAVLEGLEKKCAEWESMAANHKFDLEESTDRLEEIEGENGKLKLKFNKLRDANKHSKEDLAGKCLELAELQRKYARQVDTENEVKEALSVEEGDASKLSWEYLLRRQKEEADIEQEKINKLQQENVQTSGELDKYKDGMKKLLREKQQLADKCKEFAEMHSTFSYMEKEHESSQRMLSDMQTKYKSLQEQYDNLKFEQDISDSASDEGEGNGIGMAVLVEEKKELQGELDKLRRDNAKYSEMETLVNELQRELSAANSQIECEKNELESMANKKDVMIQALEERARNMAEAKNKIVCELDLSTEENNELKKQVVSSMDKQTELKRVIESLKSGTAEMQIDGNESDITTPRKSPARRVRGDFEEDGLSLNGSDSGEDVEENEDKKEIQSENRKEETVAVAQTEEMETDSFDLFDSTTKSDAENDGDEDSEVLTDDKVSTNMLEKIITDDIDDSVEPKDESKEETPVKSAAPPPPTPPVPAMGFAIVAEPPPLSPLPPLLQTGGDGVMGVLRKPAASGSIDSVDITSICTRTQSQDENKEIGNDNDVIEATVQSVAIPSPAPEHPAPAASTPKSFRGRGRGRGRGMRGIRRGRVRGRGRRRGRGRGGVRPKSVGMARGKAKGRGIGSGVKRRSMRGMGAASKSLTRPTDDIPPSDTAQIATVSVTKSVDMDTDQTLTTDKTDKVAIADNETVSVKSTVEAQPQPNDLMMARRRGLRPTATDTTNETDTVKAAADAVPDTAAVPPKQSMRDRMAKRRRVYTASKGRTGRGGGRGRSRRKRIGGRVNRMRRPTTPNAMSTRPTPHTPPVESAVNETATEKQAAVASVQQTAEADQENTVTEQENPEQEAGSVSPVTVKKEDNATPSPLKQAQIVEQETNDSKPPIIATNRSNRIGRIKRGGMNKGRRRPINKTKSRRQGTALDKFKSGMDEMENSVPSTSAIKHTQRTTQRTAPTHRAIDEKKKEKKTTAILPAQKKGMADTVKSWFGFGGKKAVYTAPKTETVVDGNGESHIIYKPDLDQYTQVKQTWDAELERWVFDDGEPMDDESESDDALPPMGLRKTGRTHEAVPVEKEEKDNINVAAQMDVDSLRREISKLKEENNKLKQQVGNRGISEMKYDSDVVGLDVMQQRMLEGLDQNHRILRYLHSWADNLPNALDNRLSDDVMDMSENTSFGISMFHMILILILTVCLLFWDSNNVYNDMDIFNSMIAFLKELYMMFHELIPQSLHVYENMVIELAQNAINRTTLLTQNIKLEL